MPPLLKVHPLEIPEILSPVGSFIPTWKDSPRGAKFVPRDLRSSILVNTTWREAMLPYLWIVYDHFAMAKVPIKLALKYSCFFRFFRPPFNPPRHFWGNNSNGYPLLKCTQHKSYTFATASDIQPQLRLLQNNPDMESLHLYFLLPSNLAGILDTFLSLSAPVKELHLESSNFSESEFFSFLDCFSHLKRLHVANVIIGNEFDKFGSQALSSLDSTSHNAERAVHLESLSFSSNFTKNEHYEILSILKHYPTVKHLTLNVVHPQRPGISSIMAILFEIYKPCAHVLASRDADKTQQELAMQGLEKLDFQDVWNGRYETHYSMRLGNRGRDIVAFSAVLCEEEAGVLLRRLISHAHCLQQLDVECKGMVFLEGCTTMYVLRKILDKLPALQHLRFIAHNGLAKEDSFSIFQERFGQGDPLQQPENDSSLEATASTDRGPGWACEGLESLILGGLWNTVSKDRMGPGQDTWTFESDSERYRWVARGATRFGKQFRGIIAQRIQALQNLRKLTLAGVTFDYCEMGELTSSRA